MPPFSEKIEDLERTKNRSLTEQELNDRLRNYKFISFLYFEKNI